MYKREVSRGIFFERIKSALQRKRSAILLSPATKLLSVRFHIVDKYLHSFIISNFPRLFVIRLKLRMIRCAIWNVSQDMRCTACRYSISFLYKLGQVSKKMLCFLFLCRSLSACNSFLFSFFWFAGQIFSPTPGFPCLVPVRRLFRPSRSMHFGDVSETNGRETASKTFSDQVTRNASASQNNEAQGLGKGFPTEATVFFVSSFPQGRTIRKVMGRGRGIFELQEFFFVIKFFV